MRGQRRRGAARVVLAWAVEGGVAFSVLSLRICVSSRKKIAESDFFDLRRETRWRWARVRMAGTPEGADGGGSDGGRKPGWFSSPQNLKGGLI